jgi:erythromycin esterase
VREGEHQGLDAVTLLSGFERWPTWMWANHEVAEFLGWLREWNRTRPTPEQVGLYGLDVYSLWDSLRVVMSWLAINAPEALADAQEAWRCFLPYGEDPHRYAWGTRLVPESCEPDVVSLLGQVRRRTASATDEAAVNAAQNEEVTAGAERYYRIMMRGDRDSWNVRDHHMTDTIERIAQHRVPSSRGLVWEHNTHVGDARGTDMARHGMVNVGQLLRERYGVDRVTLVGFASHRGTVLAAEGWGRPEQVLPLPPAREGSHEDLLHREIGRSAVLTFRGAGTAGWLATPLGHRAVGVVYDPTRELTNYVPNRMGARYDALLWLERTEALHPLHHETTPNESELETEPSAFLAVGGLVTAKRRQQVMLLSRTRRAYTTDTPARGCSSGSRCVSDSAVSGRPVQWHPAGVIRQLESPHDSDGAHEHRKQHARRSRLGQEQSSQADRQGHRSSRGLDLLNSVEGVAAPQDEVRGGPQDEADG